MATDPEDLNEAAFSFGLLTAGRALPRSLAGRGLSVSGVRADVFLRVMLDEDVMMVAATVAKKGASK